MKPRIYAACLASYNNGVLHGRWIEADQEPDCIQEEISEMLRESKYPNVMVECTCCEGTGCTECGKQGQVPSAEEWAIHDYESMPNLGEYASVEDISKHGLAIAEHGDAWLAWCEVCDSEEEDEERFQDAYRGKHDSLEDYVEELVADIYGDLLDAMNAHTWCQVQMGSYLDVKQMTHDLKCSGGTVIQRGHVFEVL